MRWFAPATLALVLALALWPQRPVVAQIAAVDAGGAHRVTIAAMTTADVGSSSALIGQMTQAGELTAFDVRDDPAIAGRRFETRRQFYRGIPVEGGGVTLQMAGATTVSVFGTVFTDVTIDLAPLFTSVDAARIIERAAGHPIAFGASPAAIILPSPAGTFTLAYKATVEGAVSYYVSASSGEVIKVVDDKHYDVGVGTGVLGDQKKMSTTQIGGTFRTRDTLRPASISTYDAGGNATTYNRLLNTGVSTDADLGSHSDNTWADGRIVDAHSNTGMVYDYFFRRHNWSGLDGLNRPISDIVYSGLTNNAFFAGPPFGPNSNGVMVYGQTGGGVPVTALDIAGHELMHGVTEFSLTRRTGAGFANIVWTVLGPTAFVLNGTSLPCSTTVLMDGLGVQRPFFCSGGRYVLGASHSGAINEAFSDVFGTSVEFFYQPPGSGPLKADYLMGEDITGFGPLRSLSNPGSLTYAHDNGTLGYPDHVSRMLNYALVVFSGTATNPQTVDFSPVGFVNGAPVFFLNPNTAGNVDEGGVHLNSTLFSHAFYLAIEGGRNATSGLSVTGVGAQNRDQIERAFFRAMTQLMPSSANFTTAAAALIQAATDLYGAASPPTQAVTQALVAVGLH